LPADQFRDLYRVERGALAEVVVRAEQRQPVLDRLVGTDPAHVRRVLAGRPQRGRHVRQRHTGRVGEQFAGPGRAERPGEPGVQLERVSSRSGVT
jgi:hypothetical protein